MTQALNINTIDFSLINLLIVLLINVVDILLVLTVITRNTLKDRITSVFAVLGFLMLIWIDCAYLARVVGASNTEWAELFLRLAWVATPPFFAYVYLGTVSILRKEAQMRLLSRTLIAMALVLSFLTAFTDYIVAGVSFSGRDLDIIYGRGFYPFLGVISLYMVATVLPVFLTEVEQHRRSRVRVFLLGVAIFYLANLAFNIALPVFFGVTNYYYLGDYSLVFMLGFTAYAILRYRFMGIKTVVFRGVSFALLTSLFFLVYGFLLYQVFEYLQELRVSTGQLTVISTVLFVGAIPLRNIFNRYLRVVTDRILYQKQVDYRRALVEASKGLSATININDVTKVVLDILERTVRAKKIVIFLRDGKGNVFLPYASRDVKEIKVTVPKEHLLIKYIRHEMGPLVRDELILQREQEQNEARVERLKKIEQVFEWLDVAVMLPLYVNKELTGLIVLGDKRAGTPYMQDDLSFLATLAPQAATALENARLYRESLAFGEKLKSEVKRATHELEIANAQLRDLDKAKSEFLSIASHQLYTPMTALRGYLSMLREGEFGRVAAKQKPIIKILEISSTRLINLIKNLLDVSRIESGRLELNLQSVDFGQMVRELMQDLLPNALNKKLKLQYYQPEEELPHVVVDQERVRQVVLNIIDNAIKYTDKGKVDVRVQQSDHTITLTVNDTGRGMTAEEMLRLFTKFTRVGGKSRYRKEGTGLGLYVAKQIIREHHGDIEVTSPGMDQGSTFYVHLPTEESPQALKAGEKVAVEIKTGKN